MSVVIPTLNERRNLEHVLPAVPDWVAEVIIVDGGSTDGTVAEARRLLPDVRVVIETAPGKGTAMWTGAHAALGDIVVLLDADGSMDPGEISRYVEALLSGADLVKGSRFLRGAATDDMSPIRRAGNAGLNRAVRLLYGGRYTDLCYGYVAFWRDVLPWLEGRAEGFEIETELNIRAIATGLHVTEVPSWEATRVHGAGKLHPIRDGLRIVRTILGERRDLSRSLLPRRGHRRPTMALADHGDRRVNDYSTIPDRRQAGWPTVSAVVCAHDHDRWELLVRAVDGLRNQTVPPLDILVVIDGNDALLTRARAALAAEGPPPGMGPPVWVLPNERTPGLSGARTTAVHHAEGEVIAFLDDDAVPDPDWLERLLPAYDRPSVMGAGGAVLPEWEEARPVWLPPEFDWVVGCTHPAYPGIRAEVRNVIGANMSFRRSLLLDLGGFDPLLGRVGADGAGCEETALCIRAHQHHPNGQVVYVPSARVHHRVTSERGTWKYFVRRCRAEGRSKARMAALVGPSDATSDERRFVAVSLPLAIARDLGSALRLRPTGYRRVGTVMIGTWLVATAYFVERRRLRVAEGPAAQARPDPRAASLRRTGTLDLDLAEPLPALRGVDRIRVLVRLDQVPIGVADLEGNRADLPAESVAATLWSALADEIVDRCVAAGRSRPDGLGPDGLGPAPRPGQGTGPASLTDLSVVVATRDRPDSLGRCLDSLLEMRPQPAQIIVVDNAPADDRTQEMLAGRYGHHLHIKYVREVRAGLATAHNTGLASVQTELVAFTDDDVVVDGQWAQRLRAGFDAAEQVGCVTGLIFPFELVTDEQWWVDGAAGFAKGFTRRIVNLDGRRPVDDALFPWAMGRYGSGANMAFHVDTLRRLGAFDPALGAGSGSLGGDDLAAFHDVLAAGSSLVYEPSAVVFHTHPHDGDGLRRQAVGYGSGLTAYLTHVVVQYPAEAPAMLRRAGVGIRHVVGPSSDLERRRPADMPRSLVHRQRLAMLTGPARYLRARQTLERAGPGTGPS